MKYALGRKVMLINSHSDYFKEQHTLLKATEPSENMLWTTLFTHLKTNTRASLFLKPLLPSEFSSDF